MGSEAGRGAAEVTENLVYWAGFCNFLVILARKLSNAEVERTLDFL